MIFFFQYYTEIVRKVIDDFCLVIASIQLLGANINKNGFSSRSRKCIFLTKDYETNKDFWQRNN